MAPESGDELVEFLLDHAGRQVRSVIRYDGSDSSVLYLRDDVGEDYTPQEIETVVETLRREAADYDPRERLYVHGDLACTVQIFEDALEMHFRHGEAAGTAIGLDPDAASDLYSFVEDCLELMPETDADDEPARD